MNISVYGLRVSWDKNRDMAAKVIECLLFQFLRKKAGEVERIMRPFISIRGKMQDLGLIFLLLVQFWMTEAEFWNYLRNINDFVKCD